MGIIDVLRRLFSSGTRSDEAAEREEYALADPAEAELHAPGVSTRYGSPGAQAAEAELESEEAPSDPTR
jgi:hypothetical protein